VFPAFSQPAIAGAARAWWFGQLTKGAVRRESAIAT
jgi:hypothetical protein